MEIPRKYDFVRQRTFKPIKAEIAIEIHKEYKELGRNLVDIIFKYLLE